MIIPTSIVQALRNPVSLESAHVEITIQDQLARVQVSQLFANKGGKTIECKFSFPVPEGAAVCRYEIRCF